jgi:hypothetical protein
LVEGQDSGDAGILAAIEGPVLKVAQDGFIGGVFGGKVVGGEADGRWFLSVWGVAGMQVKKHASGLIIESGNAIHLLGDDETVP